MFASDKTAGTSATMPWSACLLPDTTLRLARRKQGESPMTEEMSIEPENTYTHINPRKEIREGVWAFWTPSNISFDEFVEPLRESGSKHNFYGSLRDVLSVKGQLSFNGKTLRVVVLGGRTSAPTAFEYDRDAETILQALRDERIHCCWIKP
jgi:hypothetical protein